MKQKKTKPKPAAPKSWTSKIIGYFMSSRGDPYVVGLYYFAIMLPIALIFHQPNDSLETDFFGSYAPQARTFLEHGTLQIEEYRGPIYPIVLGLVRLLIGDYFKAGIVLSVAAAAVLLGVLYFIASRLWNRPIALWSVALTAFNPVFNHYSYEAGTDMLFAAMCFGAIYHVLQDNGVRAGIFAAVAYLTRYNGAFLLLPSVLKRKRFWIIGTFLILIAPWGIRCWMEKGNFFYNKNYLNLAYNIYGEGKGWDNFWANPSIYQKFTSFTSVITYDPGLFVKRMLSNVVNHFVKDTAQVTGIAQTILAAIGLLFLRPNRKQLLFFLFGLWMFAVNLLAFYSERFSLFLVPFYAVLAVIGCERLMEFFHDKVRPRLRARFIHSR
jgi:hypothetical protein